LIQKRLSPLVAFVMCIMWLSISHAFAASGPETMTVTAEGTASIESSNYAEARNRAIDSALGNAVVRAVDLAVPLHVRVTRQDDMDAILSASSRQYIGEYRVLDETRDGGSYGVTLSATVWVAGILADLDGLRSQLPDPGSASRGTDPSPSALFILSVGGVENYAQYTSLKMFLANTLPRVKAVHERTIQYGTVEFQIHAEGGARAFADDLSSARLPGMTMAILKRTDSRIDVDIRQQSR